MADPGATRVGFSLMARGSFRTFETFAECLEAMHPYAAIMLDEIGFDGSGIVDVSCFTQADPHVGTMHVIRAGMASRDAEVYSLQFCDVPPDHDPTVPHWFRILSPDRR